MSIQRCWLNHVLCVDFTTDANYVLFARNVGSVVMMFLPPVLLVTLNLQRKGETRIMTTLHFCILASQRATNSSLDLNSQREPHIERDATKFEA